MHKPDIPIQPALLPPNFSLGKTLLYIPEFFTAKESDQYLQHLLHNTRWTGRRLNLFGRTVSMPRLIAWHADPGVEYHYSGGTSPHHPWTPVLTEIKSRIETALAWKFNGVLLNLYRNGTDSMGWHSDDEPELGKEPCIASASFGETRRFELRHRQQNPRGKIHLPLQHGSLLTMSGDLQQQWQHHIPKEKQITGPRINLTFRLIKSTREPELQTRNPQVIQV